MKLRPALNSFIVEDLKRRKRAEGKGHHQAVIALARRRVNILWAMPRDGKIYREQPAQTT